MFGINTSLLPAKGHYFAFFACQAGILPFGVTIASQFGASPTLIGIIYLTLSFFTAIAKPSFGMLADKLQQKKPIFLSCIIFMTAAFFVMRFIPMLEEVTRTTNLLCQNEISSLEICNLRQSGGSKESPITSCSATCEVTKPDPFLDQLCVHHPSYCSLQNENTTQTVTVTAMVDLSEPVSLAEEGCAAHALKGFRISNTTVEWLVCENISQIPCNISCDSVSLSQNDESSTFEVNPQIIYFWILMITAYIFMGTGVNLGDTIVLSIIPNYGVYGQQRLYGSVGFGLLSIISGQLVDTFSEGDGGKLNFTPAFYIVLIFGVLDFVIASRLTENRVKKPTHLFKNVSSLFLNAETVLLTTAVFLVGFFSGILWTFLIVYLVSLQADQLLIGLTIGAQCFIGELPFMFVSDWFLKKIGHGHAMTLVLAVFGIRYLLYHLINNPWLVLPIETLQGICYGIFFPALATYSSIIAPSSSHATMQGILQAVFEGLGAGTGAFLGGLIFQAVGGKLMWLILGAASCCFAILHGLLLMAIQRRKTRNSLTPQKYLANGTEDLKEMEFLPVQRVNGFKEDGDFTTETSTLHKE